MKTEFLKPSVKNYRHWPVNLAEADRSDFEAAMSYNTAAVYLREINKVWLSPDSVVYKNGQVITETLASDGHKSYYQLKHLAKKVITGKKIHLDNNKKYLLVTDHYSAGHFHWFCEVLPKLVCIKDTLKNYILLLPDNPYIKKIGLDSFSMMQFLFEDIVFMQQGAFYKVPHLYYLPNVSKGGLNEELMRVVQQQFIRGRETMNKKIYISRQKAAYRKIINEATLCNVLKNHGFEIIVGEDFSLTEQVELFSSGNIFLGIHGAGLTNCVFMQPGSNVIELRRKENGPHNVGYWHLADSIGHKYYYYNGIPDSEKPLVGKGCNLTIPLNDFEKQVLQKID